MKELSPTLSVGLDALRALERDDATPLTVSATPDGRADSIRRGGDLPDGRPRLAMPEERKMTCAAFLRALRSKGDDVLYYSAQNGSLGECAAALGDAVPASALPAPFLEALAERGAPAGAAAEPEAVNVWLGDSRSTTAAHRDRAFENLYLVLAGCKRFLLLPPSAAAYLKSAKCVPARWTKHGHGWHLKDERGDAVDWLDVDLAADLVDDDGNALPRPAVAVVRPGEVLYLPAGWIHQVEQHDDTLAVNWWFPARLDGPVWAVGRLADQVGELRNRNFS